MTGLLAHSYENDFHLLNQTENVKWTLIKTKFNKTNLIIYVCDVHAIEDIIIEIVH